jgi:hypothetical protein
MKVDKKIIYKIVMNADNCYHEMRKRGERKRGERGRRLCWASVTTKCINVERKRIERKRGERERRYL